MPQHGKVEHESFVSTRAAGLHLLKETVISSLRLAADKTKQAKKIVLGGEIRPAGDEKVTATLLLAPMWLNNTLLETAQLHGHPNHRQTPIFRRRGL